jgi:hypothetical protein
MTPHSPIRELVRLREADADITLKPDETEVAVDREGATVGGLTRLWRVHRRYIVRRGLEIELKVEVPLRDFENNVTVAVPYRCRMSANGDSGRLVHELFHRDDEPWAVLEERLRRATEHWWRTDGARRGLPVKEAVWLGRVELQGTIEGMLRGCGFEAQVVADVDGWKLPPVPVKGLAFMVRVVDYPDREFNLTLSTELVVAPGTAASDPRQPNTFGAWEDRVRDCARATIKQSVSLNIYFHDRGRLENMLREALDADLGRFGRRCEWISAQTEKPNHPAPDTYNIEFSWEAMQGRVVTFKARMLAFVKAGEEPRYLRSGSPGLQAWFTKHLSDAALRLLLRSDYSALNPDYAKDFQTKLEREIQREADEIGVGVQGLVLLSTLPEWTYLSPFEVEIPSRDYKSVTADAALRFDVNIRGRFDKLANVTKLAFPTDTVKVEIERVAIRAASEVARGVHIDHYLSHFDPLPDDDPQADPCVRVQIERAVGAALLADLGLVDAKVQVRQDDSEIRQFVNTFTAAGDHQYPRFTVRPRNAKFLSHEFQLDVGVRLNGIAPAKALLLKQKQVTPQKVFEALQQWMVEELSGIDAALFRDSTATREDPLRDLVLSRLKDEAFGTYGAFIEIVHFQVVQGLNTLRVPADVALENQIKFEKLKLGYAQLEADVVSQKAQIAHNNQMADAVRDGDRQAVEKFNEKQQAAIGEQSTDLPGDLAKLTAAREEQLRALGVSTSPLQKPPRAPAEKDGSQRLQDESAGKSGKPRRGPL